MKAESSATTTRRGLTESTLPRYAARTNPEKMPSGLSRTTSRSSIFAIASMKSVPAAGTA